MEAYDYLKAYYESYDEDGRLTSRTGSVEYLTTMHYIEKYLTPWCRILEIGAGTGRYSHALARMGYRVDAVELLEHNIEIFKSKTQEGEDISIVQGNAVNLAGFADGTYDLVLVLGPMYHLFTLDEQKKALSEAVRVCKKSGVIFAAYCMGDAAIMTYGFKNGKIHEIIESCMVDPETFDTFSQPWDLFELYRIGDIDNLRAGLDVKQLHFAATDGIARHIRETMEAMDDKTFELFMKYHLATCERIELTGYSNHTLDIFRKN